MIEWLKRRIRDFFGFSRRETNGVLMLLGIAIIAAAAPWCVDYYLEIKNNR